MANFQCVKLRATFEIHPSTNGKRNSEMREKKMKKSSNWNDHVINAISGVCRIPLNWFIIMYVHRVTFGVSCSLMISSNNFFSANELRWIQFKFWPDGYWYMVNAFDAPTHFECQFHNNNHNVYISLFLLIISYIYICTANTSTKWMFQEKNPSWFGLPRIFKLPR